MVCSDDTISSQKQMNVVEMWEESITGKSQVDYVRKQWWACLWIIYDGGLWNWGFWALGTKNTPASLFALPLERRLREITSTDK